MEQEYTIAENIDLIAESRCFVHISYANLRHNLNQVKACVKENSKICGVVKANAYGHGAVPVARILASEGVDYLAVSSLGEALELKEAGLPQSIIILGPSMPQAAPILQGLGLRQALISAQEAAAYLRYIRHDLPKLNFHIKLDTGMSRHGFRVTSEAQTKQSLIELANIAKLSHSRLEGVFTHYATASDDGNSQFKWQINNFCEALAALEAQGQSFDLVHCANSASLVVDPELDYDLVRAGIILYGGRDEDCFHKDVDLKPVMTFKARLSAIYDLKAGDKVSYGGCYVADHDLRMGVVEAGYADGLLRSLSGKAVFSLRGKPIQQIGRICMDRCMVDLSSVPTAEVGDYVTILGGEDEDFVDAAEQAARAGTISYELFSLITPRVPRYYQEEF